MTLKENIENRPEIQAAVIVAGTLVILLMGTLSVSSERPQPYSPFPYALYASFEAIKSIYGTEKLQSLPRPILAAIGALPIAISFLGWSIADLYLRRRKPVFLIAGISIYGISALAYSVLAGVKDGINYYGLFHVSVVISMNAIFCLLLFVFARAALRQPSFLWRNSLSLLLFVWISSYAATWFAPYG